MPTPETLAIRGITAEEWLAGKPQGLGRSGDKPLVTSEDASKISAQRSAIAYQQGVSALKERYGEDWENKVKFTDTTPVKVNYAGETFTVKAGDVAKARSDEAFYEHTQLQAATETVKAATKAVSGGTVKAKSYWQFAGMPEKTPEEKLEKAKVGLASGFVSSKDFDSFIKSYNKYVNQKTRIDSYNQKVDEVNSIKDPEKQWAKAIEYGLKTRSEYEEAKKQAALSAPTQVDETVTTKTVYGVDYRSGGDTGRDLVKYFDTIEEAQAFADSLPENIRYYNVTTTDSSGKKTTTRFSTEEAAQKYVERLSNAQIKEALKPEGISKIIYDWGESQGDKNWRSKPLTERDAGDITQGLTEYFSAVLGSAVLNPVENVIDTISSVLSGKPPVEHKQVGRETIGLYEKDLSEAQKIYLTAGTVGATYLTAYAASLPVGLVSGRVITASSQIASKLGLNSASSVAKIAKIISSHPKLVQAVTWGAVVGVEASDIYADYKSGVSQDEILSRIAIRGASLVGGINGISDGLKAGLTKAELTRLTQTVEDVQLTRGSLSVEEKTGKLVGVTESKYIPKDIAKFLEEELPKLKGDEVVVGFARDVSESGAVIDIPVTTKYYDLLEGLKKAEKVSVESYERAIVAALPPEKYSWLYINNGKLSSLSPEAISKLAAKELGYGTLWDGAANIKRTTYIGSEGSGINRILAVISPSQETEAGLSSWQTKLYNNIASESQKLPVVSLTSDGVSLLTKSEQNAASTIDAAYKELKNVGVSASDAASIIEILTTEDPSVALSNALLSTYKMGLSDKELKAVSTVIVAVSNSGASDKLSGSVESKDQVGYVVSAIIDPDTISDNITKMTEKTVSIAVSTLSSIELNRLDAETLSSIVSKVDSKTGSAVVSALTNTQINKLSTESLSRIISKLDVSALSTITQKLSTETLATVIPSLDQVTATNIISKLTVPELVKIISKVDQVTALKIIQESQGALSGLEFERLLNDVSPDLVYSLPLEGKTGNKKGVSREATRFSVSFSSGERSKTVSVESSGFREAYEKARVITRWNGEPKRVTVRKIGKEVKKGNPTST